MSSSKIQISRFVASKRFPFFFIHLISIFSLYKIKKFYCLKSFRITVNMNQFSNVKKMWEENIFFFTPLCHLTYKTFLKLAFSNPPAMFVNCCKKNRNATGRPFFKNNVWPRILIKWVVIQLKNVLYVQGFFGKAEVKNNFWVNA